MKVAAVLFDLDGTLHDRSQGIVNFATDQFERLGIDPSLKANYVKRFVDLDANGMAWKDQVYRVLTDEFELSGNPSVEFLETEYVSKYPTFALEVTGATDALISLRERQLRLGILSNGRSDLQHAVIDALGFEEHVDAVVVSEEVGCRKPDREIFEIVLERLGVKASDTVMVGDSLKSDVGGAIGAGISPMAFGCSSAPQGVQLAQSMGEVVQVVLSRLGAVET